jgi:hypothetical protein
LTDNEIITPHFCYTTIFDAKETTGKIYTNQTGPFPYQSSTGNYLLFILYDYDTNAILAKPTANRKAATLLTATKKLHLLLKSKGFTPRTQIMDNECSAAMKEYLTQKEIKFQLAAPRQHRTNAAERAIRTFKNHFIAGLCSVDDTFPIKLWDRLLPQALLTLNLMRGSRINPAHSAWSQIFGPYDFNSVPIAPPGIRVLVHERASTQGTWEPHAVDGWYVGPAMDHYRCYRVFIEETNAERITDTISWYPTKVNIPTATSQEIIVEALSDTPHELCNQRPDNSIVTIGPEQTSVLKKIAKTFTKLVDPNNRFMALSDDEDDNIDDDNDEPNHTLQRVETIPQSVPPQRVETIIDVPITDTTNDQHDEIVTVVATDNDITTPTVSTATIPDATRIHIKHGHNTRFNSKQVETNYMLKHTETKVYYGNAINTDTKRPAEYLELSKSKQGDLWKAAMSLEFGKLTKGNGTTTLTATDTMRFISIRDIPAQQKITYTKIVCADRPEKKPNMGTRHHWRKPNKLRRNNKHQGC